MFDSLLVANRGEIAVRVFRTCRRLGIRAIAVASTPDRLGPHTRAADAVFEIGGPESYLDQAAILQAARDSGARAIHPGYGFLAESATFAQACIDAGLVWVGPPPSAMRLLGDKARAKALAEQVGVPVLPGYHGDDQSAERLRAAAAEIGFPLLIKATAGGGGRGMRVVERASDFDDALESARREARASFGEDSVLLERYLARPRHVEVQIIGDQHGHVLHLGERECSVQRRHQKLVEESPSPAVDAALRERMGTAALTLARAANYANAGTVEFLLEDDGRFSFLEVNARLQVEHPVTELVTGLDIVELQLKVAAGEALPISQSEVRFDGHAIEARLLAEDPRAGFLPSVGRITALAISSDVRFDSGVESGSLVSPHYDSLLAKLIAHEVDRQTALGRLRNALREAEVEGVRTNLDLLLALVEHPKFRAGELDTGFLSEHPIAEELGSVPHEALAAASAMATVARPPGDPWQALGAWRIGGVDQPVPWTVAGTEHETFVVRQPAADEIRVRIDRNTYEVAVVDERRVLVGHQVATVHDRYVEWQGRSYRLRRRGPPGVDDTAEHGHSTGGGGRLTAPMPAKVVKLLVEVGDNVSQGQPLVVLEAMKMEHVVQAPHAGQVAAVNVRSGDQVMAAAPLIELAEDA